MTEAQLVACIKAHIAKGEQHYISAGLHLAKLKERCPDQATFLALVKDKIGIGKSRTYELLQIADGRKTVEEVRADTAERKERHLSVPNGQDKPNDAAVIARDRAEVIRLWDKVVRAEAALAKLEPDAERPRTKLDRELDAGAFHRLRLAEARIEELEAENAELRRQLAVYQSPVRCEFVKTDGGAGAAGHGDHSGDCVARAIAIATGKPYLEVFEVLKERYAHYVKRYPRSHIAKDDARRRSEPIENGCYEEIYGPYLKSLGWQHTRIRERVYLRAGALPSGRLIVDLDRHLTTLIDGVIHDAYDSGGHGRRPVYGYWSSLN